MHFEALLLYIVGRERTFVVHVGGDLHHAEVEVDWQVVKMVIGLQDKFPSQLYTVPLLIHLIDQHCIKVFILERDRKREKQT